MAKYHVNSACFDPRSKKKELLKVGAEEEIDEKLAEKLVKAGRLEEVAGDEVDFAKELKGKTVPELKAMAIERGLEVTEGMKKGDIINLLMSCPEEENESGAGSGGEG